MSAPHTPEALLLVRSDGEVGPAAPKKLNSSQLRRCWRFPSSLATCDAYARLSMQAGRWVGRRALYRTDQGSDTHDTQAIYHSTSNVLAQM